MTTADLGTYSAGFAEFRKLMSTVPADARVNVFSSAASTAATYVSKGLDRVVAADELNDIATAYGLDDPEEVQSIISQAFENIERVPDVDEPKLNGRAKPNKSINFLSKAEFISGFIPPDYLVAGVLQRRFVYALTGQTGHAKTAIALLLAELISTHAPAFLGNHIVKKGRVIYFVGENPDDIRMRVIGADSKRDDGDDPFLDRITFIPGVFNIGEMHAHIANHAQGLGGVDLVIIDTSAAYFLGNEELNNTQMGNHARMLRRLTELPGGPCVLVLCHPIKYVQEPTQLLPRGGGAFLAEMDGNLTAWKHDDTLIELHHNKIRGPGFEPMTFKLETIRTDALTDNEGRQLPTVRAIAISESEEDKQTGKTRHDEDQVLATLLKKIEGDNLSIAEIARRCAWVSAEGIAQKSRAHRVLDRLETAKLLRRERGQWELTEKGKDSARKAALRLVAQAEREQEADKQFDMLAPQSDSAKGIPFMITVGMKAKLRERGLSNEEISNLTPREAHDLLNTN